MAAKQQSPPVYIGDKQTAGLLEWAKSIGIQLERLAPAEFGGLRGLAATAGIKADDILISVPRQRAITLAPKQKCPCPEFIDAGFWAGAPWFAKIGVLLLHEQQKGDASPLSTYIRSLPSAVDSPVTWSDQQLQLLQYPHLQQQVRATPPRRRARPPHRPRGTSPQAAWRPPSCPTHGAC